MRNLQLQFEDDCYPIWIGVKCLDEVVSRLHEIGASSYHFITDKTVNELHTKILYEQLSDKNRASLWVVEDGEVSKTLEAVEGIARRMIQAGFDRSGVIIAVGGGVIGNLAGLVAGLFFRGVRFVHVPTTLIAAADSVASLKQAVNLPEGKNLLGCFHKPTVVLIDISYLRTLPAAQIRSGMSEIIKNALTVAVENIPLLERGLRLDANYSDSELMLIVEAGLLAKQKVMRFDRFERKEALVFEYGHTVGHAIELSAEGRLPHGDAVGLGMIVAAEISNRLGMLSNKDLELHYHLLQCNGLSVSLPLKVTVSEVMALLSNDNKRGYIRARPNQIAMILLERIGFPAGPIERPLVLVESSLIQACIECCLVKVVRGGLCEGVNWV